MLQSIKQYLQTQQYNDILIAADLNENIIGDVISKFYRENGLVDVDQIFNNITGNLDHTFQIGSKCID